MEGRLNHYPHHLGDYATGTLGFSMLEHGAYGLLIDAYYASEQALLAEDVYAIGKATNAAERKAVDKVLARKFELRDGRYHHERIEAEIEAYRQRAETARTNGKQPKRKQVGIPPGKPVASASDSQNEASAKLASSHKPEEKQSLKEERTGVASTPAPEPPRAFPAADDSRVTAMHGYCIGEHLRVNPLEVRQWISDGVTEEILRAAIDRHRKRKPSQPLGLAFLQLMIADVRSVGVGYDAESVVAETMAAINAKESHAAH